MKNENFDKEAMERKIKKNLEAGFKDLNGIRLALQDELKTNLDAIRVHETRALELSDQIEYIEEKLNDKPDSG